MLVAFSWLLRAFATGSIPHAFLAGGSLLLLSNVHTYDLFMIFAATAAYIVALGLAEWRFPIAEILLAAIAFLCAAPMLGYQYFVFGADPVFREKALTITASPPALDYAFSFGLPWFVAILGAAVVFAQRRWDRLFLVMWAAAGMAVAYVPFSFQRKVAEGLQLPFLLLSAVFIGEFVGELSLRWPRWPAVRRWIPIGFVLLCVPSNAYFLASAASSLITNNREQMQTSLMPPFYLSRSEMDALTWLRDSADPDAAILCEPTIGSYVPGITGRRVYVGHWAETLRYPEKLKQLRWFFDAGTDDLSRRALVSRESISYLYYGAGERSIGAFNPASSNSWSAVYANAEVTIFRFSPTRGIGP
jgi:hypothetical protein